MKWCVAIRLPSYAGVGQQQKMHHNGRKGNGNIFVSYLLPDIAADVCQFTLLESKEKRQVVQQACVM